MVSHHPATALNQAPPADLQINTHVITQHDDHWAGTKELCRRQIQKEEKPVLKNVTKIAEQ